MTARKSLKLPIILAIIMIVLLLVLTVGWVLSAVFSATANEQLAPLYWTLLSIGATFIALLLAGVIVYLIFSIKAINLNRRQSNFIDSVTHELKSPIASMKLYLQTLSRHPVDEAERTAFYRTMLDDVERLDHLINQMLQTARLEAGRARGEVEPVALEQLLDDCARSVCHRYRVPSDVIEFDVEPCTVHARRVDLDVIFRNLLDNAVKYAGEPPRVEVLLRNRGGDRALVRVVDNGRGVPLKLRRKIFGRFVRLGHELQRDKPGTGLGLFLVREMVRRLRGRVRVQGRANQPGTTFEVELPIGKETP